MTGTQSPASQRVVRWIFVLTPLVLVVLTEAFKTHLIWRLRIVDFVDLVFTAPFFLVMLLYFNWWVYAGQRERRLYLVSLGVMALMLYGHAMHLTGNAINTYSTEIHHYLDRIPPDTYQLIYFFDEDLGHWLLYTGLFASLAIWVVADRQVQAPSWQDWAAGGVFGLSYAVAVIESSQPWIGFTAALVLAVCSLWGARLAGQRLKVRLAQSIWVRFCLAAAVALVVGELLYLAWFGSFIQPSQMGL